MIQKELRERLLLYMTPQAERKAAEGGAKKHAERAVPAGTSFPKESFKGGIAAEKEAAERQKVVAVATGHRRRRKSFLPYFLYFTKSRKKKSPQGGGETAERRKDLIGFVRICSFVRCFEVCKTSKLPLGRF